LNASDNPASDRIAVVATYSFLPFVLRGKSGGATRIETSRSIV
jgi:hypothetical protein